MDNYSFLNLPQSCVVNHTIYKKMFYENARLLAGDKLLIRDVIQKITWLYCLKPETINVSAYKDDTRDYPEIEVVEVSLHNDRKLDRIAEIIMRSIPYPMLLFFRLDDKAKIFLAHQRISQSDGNKNTIEDFVETDWFDASSDLLSKLDTKLMRFTNLFALYSDLVDVVSVHNISAIMPLNGISGAEARELSAKIEDVEQDLQGLRAKMKKETQFNRKMELYMEIKKLMQIKTDLLKGD